MIPGFHSGGLWLHSPEVALAALAEMGYRSIAIRPRPGHLNPGDPLFESQWTRLLEAAQDHHCQLVVDTESGFVIDPRRSSAPSILDASKESAEISVAWYERWIRAASLRPGTIVCIGSGLKGEGPEESELEQFADKWHDLLRQADDLGVNMALRPATGHLVGSVAEFERLAQWLPNSRHLGLAADVGEMLSAGEMPLVTRLQRNLDSLRLVFLCDHAAPAQVSTRVSHTQKGWPDGWMGRHDVPIGTGDVAIERIIESVAAFGLEIPVLLRVEGRAAWGLESAESAMNFLGQNRVWMDACHRRSDD